MALIEGIGDEVVLVVGGFIIVVLLTLAWFSTQVRERPRPEVVVLDRDRIARALQRIRNATTNSLTQTPIGFVIRPRGQAHSVNAQSNSEGQASGEDAPQTIIANTGTDEEVSVLYAEVRPTQPSQGPNASEDNVAASPEIIQTSQVSTDTPLPNQEASQAQPTNEVRESEAVIEPQSCPDITSPSELRKRRVEFFTHDRSSVDDSQASATTTTRQSEPESTTNDTASESNIPSEEPSTEPAPQPTPQPTPDPSPNTQSTEQNEETEIPNANRLDGHIRVRLKYLDERQRLVQARPESTIVQFKRLFFDGELSENMSVRLIYNGQELQGNRTLQSYNVEDSSVIHCLLSRGTAPNNPNNVVQGINFDMGTLVFPLFGLILVLIWYCRVMYRSYFNAMSTFSLVGITFLFCVALMASFRTRDNHEHVN